MKSNDWIYIVIGCLLFVLLISGLLGYTLYVKSRRDANEMDTPELPDDSSSTMCFTDDPDQELISEYGFSDMGFDQSASVSEGSGRSEDEDFLCGNLDQNEPHDFRQIAVNEGGQPTDVKSEGRSPIDSNSASISDAMSDDGE
jgi:hypothetical protein